MTIAASLCRWLQRHISIALLLSIGSVTGQAGPIYIDKNGFKRDIFTIHSIIDNSPQPKQPIPSPTPPTSRIAIIIDDIGYNKRQGLAAIGLPGAITYAVIPHSPNAKQLAQQAWRNGKEIMLHMPMSSVNHHKLDQGGLTQGMGKAAFTQALQAALEAIPHISGVNNHMGSLLTQQPVPMQWLMSQLEKRNLYFIDSRTTANSIAWETAQQYQIPTLKRDVFLDNNKDYAAINQQFKRLISIAKRKGSAVAIAHPYPETILYLKSRLPQLSQENIRVVSASALLNKSSSSVELADKKM